LVKITTLREDKVIASIKKAFPRYELGNYTDLGRLLQPQDFRYKNRTRLEQEFTYKIIQAFHDIIITMQHLDKKRQAKILTSLQFNDFLSRIINPVNKDDKIHEDYLASYYTNMVKHGMKGITNHLPREFTELIDQHLKPLITLLNSISEYSKQVGKKGSTAYGARFEVWSERETL